MRVWIPTIGICVASLACIVGTLAQAPAGPYVPPGIEKADSALVPIRLDGPAGAAVPLTRWEYTVIEHDGGTDAAKMSALGSEGWELCGTQSQVSRGNAVQTLLIFKRQAIPEAIFEPITPGAVPGDGDQ